ncbi:MucBP domain-containing protein [Lactobacillus apis]|uniref:MucBP domain-containing protein n=1 Tax=Lactobacillus apis TaxID=303541 RepID=UPI00274241A3|nr:MucBP domain-containing protein [Lactobacillus apis]WLS84826.1 MucBP domain-containing protein [Lactobacillus apis]
MNRQTNRHLKFKELLLNSLAIVAFGTTSIGTNPVAGATTGSSTFSLRASDGKSATYGAGNIATPKKEKLRKTSKKDGKNCSRTFVLGASDGTMTNTEDEDAAPTPGDKGYVTVHYLDRTGKTLTPDKILQGKIGSTYSTSARKITGYSLFTAPAITTGTYNSKQQSITYVYELTGAVGIVESSADVETDKSQTKNATPNVANQADVTSRNLPQTGIKQGVQLSFQGLGFLSIFGGLIGTWCSRKGIKYS